MPHPHSHPHPHAYTMPPPFVPQAMMQDPTAFTSRVCTPTPEGVVTSPPNIDPALSGMPSPMQTPPMRSDPKKTLLIPLGIEELRAMVFEAVQKAMSGMEARKENASGGRDENVEIQEAEGGDVQSTAEVEP